MGVASGCGEQEVGVASGVGGIYGCGCKEVYRFSKYPYSSCICSFLQQHPYFLFIFLNIFRSLYSYYMYSMCESHYFTCKCTCTCMYVHGHV